MKLKYPAKRPAKEYLEAPATPIRGVPDGGESVLIHGPNADVLRALLKHHSFANSVDLIYVDPPFATNTVFRVGGERTATISSQADDEIAYEDTLRGEEFIEFLRERVVLLRELLSDVGSIYLHIDYKIGHYVKVMMDEVFGIRNFRNDITRIKCNPKNFARRGYGNIKDMVLFYTKSDQFIWNEPRQRMNERDIERLYSKVDSRGRRYTTVPVHAPGETSRGATSQEWKGMRPPKGRHWRSDPTELDRLDKQGLIEWSRTGNPRKINFADDAQIRGKKVQDIWDFKDDPYPKYPTQKNLEMLEMLVSASSDPQSTVLDCFCGSGTTLVAAEKLGRRWIGVDESRSAIDIARRRLLQSANMFGRKFVELNYINAESGPAKSEASRTSRTTSVKVR